MEETRSEVFLHQKEVLEKLNIQILHIRKMEDFFGYKEKIQDANLSPTQGTVF